MGLKADVDEVATAWKKASLPVKAYLLLSGFLAVSSVASLSEIVTKWKGFFKDAIDFYRQWVSLPIKHFIEPLGIHVQRADVDFILLFLLLYGSLIRFGAVTGNMLEDGAEKIGISDTLFLAAIPIVPTIAIIFTHNNSDQSVGLFSVVILVAIGLLAPIFSRMTKIWIYYAQIVGVFLTVGILAAINAGLSK